MAYRADNPARVGSSDSVADCESERPKRKSRLGLPKSHVPRLRDWMKRFLDSISHLKTKSRYQSSVNDLGRLLGNPRLSGNHSRSDFRISAETPRGGRWQGDCKPRSQPVGIIRERLG